jgi:hypothetical protein
MGWDRNDDVVIVRGAMSLKRGSGWCGVWRSSRINFLAVHVMAPFDLDLLWSRNLDSREETKSVLIAF